MTELPWLEKPLAQLLDLHAQGRLPHALLIRGYEGWGETVLANRLALSLLDRDAAADARQLAHPDLKWTAPEGSVIRVDEIRELAEFAIGTRQSAACKVAVVESAELMNPHAANALLKTLEEPPPDTYLLLTSCRPARLLPTIVSRCQVIKLRPEPLVAREWLLGRWPQSAIDAKLFECGGAPLTVDRALSNDEPALEPLLEELAASKPVSGSIAKMLEWDVDRLTSGWYRYCGALLGGERRLPGADQPDKRALARFVDELQRARHQLLTTNSANQRLLYERLGASWQALLGHVDSRRSGGRPGRGSGRNTS